ncbi:unnamed protein product [Peniophora sp. CBMAI 1063]|nr:unnamed protein product [Peniophora sp. CBMAI 1063]
MSNGTIGNASSTNSSDTAVSIDLADIALSEHLRLMTGSLVDVAIVALISQRSYAYIARGGKGSTFCTVICLWLLNTTRLIWNLSDVYLIYTQQAGLQLPGPQQRSYILNLLRKRMGAFVTFLLASVFTYTCMVIIVWRQLHTLVGRSKFKASLLTLLLWLPSIWIADFETTFALTHVLAITQIGMHGTAHAFILPKDDFLSDCPRLRMPARLRAFAHAQQRSRLRLRLLAVVMCTVNVIVVYGLCRTGECIQSFVPGGLYISFGDVYTLLYLSIKNKHAAIGSGGNPEIVVSAPEEVELQPRPAGTARRRTSHRSAVGTADMS